MRRRLDRFEVDDAGLFGIPGKMIVSASALMARARRRGFIKDAELEIRRREIEAAGAILDFASTFLDGVRDFVQARNALRAVLSGDVEVVELYRKRLRLPVTFPENKMRVRGEEWRFRDAVAEVLHERRWLRPPGCTHISRYIRNRAWQILKERKKEDEQDHIDARERNIVIRNFSTDVASSLGYDESYGIQPPRVAAIDFRLDVASSMEAVHADPQFRSIMAALLLDEKCWADLSSDPHFSGRFRREYETKLRHFRALMAAYLEPPLRRTLEERIAAEARNRRPPDPQK